MTRRMRTSKAGLELVKSFEGLRVRAVKLPDGRWTIGYGHTQTARENLRITRADAEAVLREYDLPPVEQMISQAVLAPLNQNEFDALVSFVFNIGTDAFEQSLVLHHLNAGEPLMAMDAMSHWRKAYLNGRLSVVDALVRRRAMEQALFLKHPAGIPAAPSRFIRPVEDGRSLEMVKTAAKAEAPIKPMRAPDTRYAEAEKSDVKKERAVEERMDSSELRLTRELGSAELVTEKGPAPQVDEHRGPTPDEITRAISALAHPDKVLEPEVPEFEDKADEPAPLELGKPLQGADHASGDGRLDPVPTLSPPPFDTENEDGEGDLPLLPNVDYGPVDEDKVRKDAPLKIIDDLEPANIDPLVLEQAFVDANANIHTEGVVKSPRSALYSLLGLGGVVLGALSGFKLGTLLGSADSAQNTTPIFASFAGVVLGVFLVVTAVYMMVRQKR